MKKIYYLTGIVLCFFWAKYTLNAQSFGDQKPFFVWDAIIGGDLNERFSTMIELPDGSFILGGHSYSFKSGDKSQDRYATGDSFDYWIVKMNANGQVIWDKTIGGNLDDYVADVLLLPDGNILIGGHSRSTKSFDKSENSIGLRDYWIVKIDQQGNILWDKTIGGSGSEDLTSMTLTADNGIILGGVSFSGISGNKTESSRGDADYWIVKINQDGDIMWDKTLGGNQFDRLSDMITLSNGEIFLAGSSKSNISGEKSENSYGGTDFWVVKLNPEGEIIWDKTYGGSGNDAPNTITILPNNHIVLGGGSTSSASGSKDAKQIGHQDFWIVGTDQNGNQLWDEAYGGDLDESIATILSLPDGGLLLGGYSNSNISGDKSERRWGFTDRTDYWTIKIDANRNKVWDNTVGDHNFEQLGNMLLTSDGGLLLGGYSSSLSIFEKSENSKGFDYWIVRFEENDDNLPLDIFLKNAETEETVQQIKGGEIIAIDELAFNFFTITAEGRPFDFGSVHFELQGPITVDKTENLPPYSLFGKNSPDDLTGQSLPEGDYILKITPYAENKKQGLKGTTREVSFTITGDAPAPISRFVLVNADTEQDVQVLEEGDVINLNKLESRRLSIRAETRNDRVGSVLLELESDQRNHTQTENLAPYALFGGEPKTNYFGKSFTPGEYTIKATPYLGSNLSEGRGQTKSLKFTLVESFIKGIVLVNPQTGEDIGLLKDDMTLPCGQDFSIRADVKKEIESVSFVLENLDRRQTIINRIENLAPYSLLGETLDGDFIPWKALSSRYKLTVYAYTEDNASVPSIESLEINFTVPNDMSINQLNLIDAGSNQVIGDFVENIQINVPDGGVSVGVDASDCVQQVFFEIKKEEINDKGITVYRFVLSNREKTRPFSLIGDEPNDEYLPWFPEPGTYQFNLWYSNQYLNGGQISFKFHIVEETNAEQITLYPNPGSQDKIQVSLSQESNHLEQVTIRDKQGNLISTQKINPESSNIDISHLTPGFYFLEFKSGQNIYRKTFIKN